MYLFYLNRYLSNLNSISSICTDVSYISADILYIYTGIPCISTGMPYICIGISSSDTCLFVQVFHLFVFCTGILSICRYCFGEVSPVCAVVGGVLGQEIIKVSTYLHTGDLQMVCYISFSNLIFEASCKDKDYCNISVSHEDQIKLYGSVTSCCIFSRLDSLTPSVFSQLFSIGQAKEDLRDCKMFETESKK